MSDSDTKQDILIVVQCRYNSRRLPGKALLELAGRPMLDFLLRRLGPAAARQGALLLLATTEQRADDAVAAVGRALDVPVIRGATNDLLARYRQCLAAYPARQVVRVTADNPLTCPAMLSACLDWLRDHDPDYLAVDGMPHGTATDVFASRTIAWLDRQATDVAEREHINLHILKNPDKFAMHQLTAPKEVYRPDLRLTVDTAEDYARLVSLFVPSDPSPWAMPLTEAVRRLQSLHARTEMAGDGP